MQEQILEFFDFHPQYRQIDIYRQPEAFDLNAHDMLMVYPYNFNGEKHYIIAMRRKVDGCPYTIAECPDEDTAKYHAQCFSRLFKMDISP